MSRAGVFGLSFLLLAALAPPSRAAEICSSSTLVSPAFSVARWCGVPPGAGTLRITRRSGGAEEFGNVPINTYREVIRAPNVARYVSEEVQPRFQRMSSAPAVPQLRPALHVAPVQGRTAPLATPVQRTAALRTVPTPAPRRAALPVSTAERRVTRARPAERPACAPGAVKREPRCRR